MKRSWIHVSLNFLLIVLLVFVLDVAPENPCEPSEFRTADQYTIENRSFLWEERVVTIPVCTVNDGAECFSRQFFRSLDYPSAEHAAFVKYLKNYDIRLDSAHRGPVLTANGEPEPSQAKFNEKFLERLKDLEMTWKSFFCKSGKCEDKGRSKTLDEWELFKCASGPPVPASTFQISEFQEKIVQINKEIQVFSTLEPVCEKIMQDHRTVREDTMVADLALVKRGKKSDLIEVLPVCYILEGEPCFPATDGERNRYRAFYREFNEQDPLIHPAFEDHRARLELRSNGSGPKLQYVQLAPRGRLKVVISGEKKTRSYPEAYWFCKSGKCVNRKCTGGERKVPLVLQNYLTLKNSATTFTKHLPKVIAFLGVLVNLTWM